MHSEGDRHNDTTNTDFGGDLSDLSELNLSHIWSGERNPSAQKRIKELTDFKRKAKGQEVDRSFILNKAARRGHSHSSFVATSHPSALRSGGMKEESKKNPTVITRHTAPRDTSGQANVTKYVLTDLYTMDEPSAYVRLRAVYETARAGGFSSEKPSKTEEAMGATPIGVVNSPAARLMGFTPSSSLLINGNEYEDKVKKEGNQSLVCDGGRNKVKIGDNYYDLDATPSPDQQQLTAHHTSRSRPTFAKGSTIKPGQVVTSKLSSIPLEPLDRTVVTLHPSVRAENPLFYRLAAPMPGMVNDEPPMMHKKDLSDHNQTPAVPVTDSNDKNSSLMKVVTDVTGDTSFGGEGSVGALNYVRIIRDVAARREALEREGLVASNASSADDAHEHVNSRVSTLSSTSTVKGAVRDKTQSQHNQRTTDEMFPSTEVCRNWRDGPIAKHVLSWEPQEFRDMSGGAPSGSILRSVGPFDRKRTAGGLAKQEAALEARSQADRKILQQQKRIERRLKGNKYTHAERSKRREKTKGSEDEANATATSDDERLISSSSNTSSSSDDGVDPHLRSFLSPLEEAKLIAQAAKIGEENVGTVTTKHLPLPQQQHNVPPQIRSNDTNRPQSTGLANLRVTSPSSRAVGAEDDQANKQSLATMYSFVGDDNDRANQFKFRVETDEPPPSPTGQFIELLTEAVGVEEGLRDDFASRVAAEREKLIEENRLEAVKKLLLLRGKNADHIVTDEANRALSITNTLNTLSMTAAQDTAIATEEADRIDREKQRIKAEKIEEEQEKQRSTLRNLQQEAEAEKDFYKKRRLSLLAVHQPPMNSFRPSCSVPGRAVKYVHEHGDDEINSHGRRQRHQPEIDEGIESSTLSVQNTKGASPLSSPRILLGVGNLKVGGGATPRSRNNPILMCNNPESKRSSASPSPRSGDPQHPSKPGNVNNRNASSPAKKKVSFFERNKSLAVVDISHSPPSPQTGHLSNGERFEWKESAAPSNQRASSQTVLSQNQSQSPTELLSFVSAPYVPPILITTATNNDGFTKKNNNNSFSFSSDQGMANSNVHLDANHGTANATAADVTSTAADVTAKDQHANIKAGAERREMYKCAALSRKEIETLWSGVMTACGVLRFAPLKRSQRESLMPRPATCAFSLVGGSSPSSPTSAVRSQQPQVAVVTQTDLDAPYKAYLEALAEGRTTESKTEAELRADRRRSSSVLASVALLAAKRAKSEAAIEGEEDEEESDKGKMANIEGELLFKNRAALVQTSQPPPQNTKTKNASLSPDLIVLKSFIRTTSEVAGNSTPVSNVSSPRSPRRTQDIPGAQNNGHAIDTESDQKHKKEGGGVGHSNTRTALEATLPKVFAGKSGAWLRRLYFPFVYHQMLLAGNKEEEKGAHPFDAWPEKCNGRSLLARPDRDRNTSAFAESLRKSVFPSVDLQMSTRLLGTFSDDFISQTKANATVVPGREVQQYYSKATAASEVLNSLIPRGGLPRYIRPGLNDESLRQYLHQVKMNTNYDPLLAVAARNAGKLVYVPAPHNPGDTSQSSDSSEEKDLEAARVEQQHQSPRGHSQPQSQPSHASPFKSVRKTQKQQLRDHIRNQRGRTAIFQDKDRFGIERAKVMEGKSTGRNSTRAIAHRMRLERKRGFRTSIETVFDFVDEMEVAEDLLREIGLTLAAEVTLEEAEEREQEELEVEIKRLVHLSQNEVERDEVADPARDFGEMSFSAAKKRLLPPPNVSKQIDFLYESTFSAFRHDSSFGRGDRHKNVEEEGGETSKSNDVFSNGDSFLLPSLSPRLARKSHYLLRLTKEEEAAVIEQAKANIKRKKRMEQDSLLHIIYHHNQQQQKIAFVGGGASASGSKPSDGHDGAANTSKRISGRHQKVSLITTATDVSIDDVPQSKFRVSIWKDMNRKRRQKIVSDERERAGKEVFTERDEEGDLIDYKMDLKARHKEQLMELCMEEISRRMTMSGEENNEGNFASSSSANKKRPPSFSGDPTNLTAIEREIIFSRLPLNESTVPTYFAQPRKGIDAQLQQSSGGGVFGASSFFGMVGGGGGNGGSSSAGGGGNVANASLSIREMEDLAQQFIRDAINDEIWHSYSEGRTNKVLSKRAALEKLNEWLSQQMRLGRRLGVPNQIQAAEKLAKLQREVSSGPRQSPSAFVHDSSPSLTAALGKACDNENSLTGEELSPSRRHASANSHIPQTTALIGGTPKGVEAAKSTLSSKEGVARTGEGNKPPNVNGEKSAVRSTSRTAAIDDSSSVRSRSPSTVIHNARPHSPPPLTIIGNGNQLPGDKQAETSHITGKSFNTNNTINVQAVYPYITDPSGNTFVSAKEDLSFQKTLIAQNFSPTRAPRANQQSVNRDRKTLSDKQFFAKLKASEDQSLLNSRKSLPSNTDKDLGDADSNASLSATKIMSAATPHPSILYQVSDELRKNQTDLRALKAKAKEEEEESMTKEVTGGGLGIFAPPRDRRKFLSRGGRPPASSLLLTAPDTENNDNLKNASNNKSLNLIKMVGNRFGAIKKSAIPPRPSSATEMREVLERNKELLLCNVGSSQRENSGASVGLAVSGLKKRPASAAAAAAYKNFGGSGGSYVRPSSSSTVVIAGKVFTYDANFMTQSSNAHEGEERGASSK